MQIVCLAGPCVAFRRRAVRLFISISVCVRERRVSRHSFVLHGTVLYRFDTFSTQYLLVRISPGTPCGRGNDSISDSLIESLITVLV